MGSSQTRNPTRVSSIGKQILYHWATRETLFRALNCKWHTNQLKEFSAKPEGIDSCRLHCTSLVALPWWLTPLVAQRVNHLPAMWETWVWPPGWDDLLEKEMATPSSNHAWKIPRTEEPGRLQSMGSQRVTHGWATSLLRLHCTGVGLVLGMAEHEPQIVSSKLNLFSFHFQCYLPSWLLSF